MLELKAKRGGRRHLLWYLKLKAEHWLKIFTAVTRFCP
jgi:hypothetical protein